MVKRTNINRITKTGFTLIEAVVAIAILVSALTAPMVLATKSISSAVAVQNQITAFYLAQEGVEYIRNKRDNNFINPPPQGWLGGLNQCFGASGCKVDIPNNTILVCGGVCPLIKYDSAPGGFYYNYVVGNDTIFTRTVKITKISAGGVEDEAKVESIVSWKERTGDKTVVIEEHLFNWK